MPNGRYNAAAGRWTWPEPRFREAWITVSMSAVKDSGWRTIHGVHVHIGADGKIDKGPAKFVGTHPAEHGHDGRPDGATPPQVAAARPPSLPPLAVKAAKMMGTTDNARSASFLLPNGEYLKQPLRGGAHGDIISVFDVDDPNRPAGSDVRNKAIRQFMTHGQAARVVAWETEYNVELSTLPNPHMLRKIEEDSEGKRINIDVVGKNGKVKKSFSVEADDRAPFKKAEAFIRKALPA